ncbi:MAG TPA: 2-oxoacid:acceptor oxidoreductase family protein [Phycisphaerae bacterium]|jgi:indolepyruvate ferredoxin oxidoreductase|nr:indolepyruvate ferredoxin oxidoreductase [Phycisphaerae bacterium]HOB72964.1 2-oxoacid:acceptor oxidoreductase family protein [Phycisphaerae bacterium]HOJ52987.1 2-oxoacid:acceptor oxidoreductase family protein [Phycisphaerae bacterium]HOL24724.1 2-oxoacid:acceptor oxidoreductase family protein [Phycisphaerae bacterium]HPP19260.1 2-oxoacid:acceptor oxidoreductase family protein [Phycisphaerae bacterium]
MSKKTTIHPKFLREGGTDVFNGNELLVKGALETEGGVHLLTGYPGSPVATFFDVLNECAPLLREHGIEGRLANNEALSVAALNGSQMGPLRGMAVFKSVGLHVASDALALANLAGPNPDGGAVVVAGDDPWSESTQVPADSRFLFRHLFVPCLEPSTPQEVKDFVDIGFKLSRGSGLYTGYILTTTLAEGGGTVECRPNHYPLTNSNHPIDLHTYMLNLEKTVLLPPRTGRNEVELPERYERLFREINRLGLNRLMDVPANDELLIVTSGMAYQYVHQALAEAGLLGRIPILKLDVTFPLDRRQIEPLVARFEHLVVVEERRSFIEEQIAHIALRLTQAGPGRVAKIWGKQFPKGVSGLPSALGLNASIVADRLGRFLRAIESPLAKQAAAGIDAQLRLIADAGRHSLSLPARTPTFCPGCPHRDSAGVLLEIRKLFADEGYMRKHHRRGAIDLVFHGDTGCYTMLMFEPNKPLMHNYSGMGLGGGTGSGIDPFIRNKQLVFMGDSTFFHSGTIAISNAIAGRQDITFVILANGTTAMTGHQPLPALPTDLLDRPIPAQDIEQIVRAVTGGNSLVLRVNPEDRPNYKRILEQTILADGVKVIIADKECGITYNRRRLREERKEQRRYGFVPKKIYMNITPEVCENCRECTNNTGCPGLTIEQTDYGPKIGTDLSWCVNDGACARLDACPSFEQVIVTRKRPPRPRGHKIMLEDIPEPAVAFNGDVWRAWIAGVGGMGIGTVTSILVHAGRHDGYYVQFSDKKGLAIRNGGVYSQVIFSRKPDHVGMTVPYGKADLLMGIDLLEAVRAVDANQNFRVAVPERTAAVVNTDRTPTIPMLMGRDDFRVEDLEAALRKATRPDCYFSARISSLCERIFGTKLYANITMLGVAYQRGLIPVTLEALKEGIRNTIKADFKKNLRAFEVGRKLVSHPELFWDSEPAPSLARTVREKTAYLNMRLLGSRRALRNENPRAAGSHRLPDTDLGRKYKSLVYSTLRACRELDRETMRAIAIRIYDLIQWGGVRYAKRYVERVRRVFLADLERHNFAATRAVVWNLAKLMLIKDEFYVAYLLTSYEKLRRDRQRYNVNPANGDRIRYKRTFHPRFFGRQIDITIPHWTLYILRKFRFLRRVLPWYHTQDRQFLRWYEGLVDGFAFTDDASYAQYVEALETVRTVTGYSEIRWPKMEAARARAEQILAAVRKAKASHGPKLTV